MTIEARLAFWGVLTGGAFARMVLAMPKTDNDFWAGLGVAWFSLLCMYAAMRVLRICLREIKVKEPT